MKRLTEEMVIARTKISDMSKIKRLNCWGSELSDITLLRRMPNVEVLSLSVNKIKHLADLENCRQLQELYVRQNEIKDLNQICYLQNLPNLKHFWLGENPCASTDGYRLAVIRTLPQLQKLDNVAIHPEELADALKKGRVLLHPEEPHEPEDEYEPASDYSGQNSYKTQYQEQYYQPERNPPRQEPEYDQDDPVDYYDDEDRRGIESPPIRQSPPRRQVENQRCSSPEPEAPVYYNERRKHSFEESPKNQQYYDRSPNKDYVEDPRITPDSPRELKIPISHSTNSIKEYSNGDRQYQQPAHYKTEGSDGSNHSHSGAYESPRIRERCDKNNCPANHRLPFNRRPVTRNSNILSAVLCLVKELDYPSLEVVEMTIRCRMDELEE